VAKLWALETKMATTGIHPNIEVLPTVGTPIPYPSSTEQLVPQWYAIYTCARHEKYVARQLEERGIAHFLPLYRSWHTWKDRRKQVELALFPSYVFVNISMQVRLRVLQLQGVVHLVTFNGQPAALPQLEIDALRNGLAQRIYAEPHPYLTAGRRVRVCRGPLVGTEGILIRWKDKLRVVISLEVLMRSVAVEVDAADLDA
jgi:transcription antitermination factor NusG